MPLLFKYDFERKSAAAGSNESQSSSPIFDHFLEQLRTYIGNNTTLYIPTENNSEVLNRII